LAANWIMLGSGAVARECFLPSFERLGTLDKLTVVDITVSPELRKAWPGVNFVEGDFRSMANLPRKSGITAAIITLPNCLHEEAVIGLLNSGFHALCEKPLALTEDGVRKMRDAAEKNERLLAVNMVRRLYPSIAAMARMIGNGELGKITRVTMEHGGPFRWPVRSFAPFQPQNGGVFADMGVHYLDLAELFVGPAELKSYRDDWRGGVEAEAEAELESASGATVRIMVSRLRTLSNTITVEGVDGTVEADVDSLGKFQLFRPGDDQALEIHPIRRQPSAPLPVSFQQCFERQIQRFDDRIAAGNHFTEDADTALRSARIIEQAYRHRCRKSSPQRQDPNGFKPAASLITGATGFIGTRLVERLFDGGATDVTGIIRRPQNCAAAARFPLKLVNADLLDFNAVRKAMEGQTHVFHLAYGRDGANAEAITIQGTENVVNAAIEAGCEAVVVLSTINVIGWPSGDTDESAPYRPAGGTYGLTKAAMEKWCLKRARESGKTRIVVLLPSCVYGPGGKTFTELPAELASQGAFGWISGGAGIANYVFIDNLIDAIFLAASKPEAHGRRFIVNDGWTSWREFLNPIVKPWEKTIASYESGELARLDGKSRRGALKRALKAAGSSAEFRHQLKQTPLGSIARALAPKSVLKAGTATAPENGTKAALPPAWLEDLFGNCRTRFSSARAQSELGWVPRTSLEEGQRISVEHLRARGLSPAV
jgi:nucleoside-diphosphate-sugar epimerase/predicted dehydrogenase